MRKVDRVDMSGRRISDGDYVLYCQKTLSYPTFGRVLGDGTLSYEEYDYNAKQRVTKTDDVLDVITHAGSGSGKGRITKYRSTKNDLVLLTSDQVPEYDRDLIDRIYERRLRERARNP